MHVRDLLELGALVAVHGPTLIHSQCALAAGSAQQYWTASKCRLERWSRVLRQCAPPTTASELEAARDWQRIRPLIEEILGSELLTRLWTATAAACDRRRNQAELEPLARSIYVGHLEARNRALNVMVYGRGFDASEAVVLNRLRRRIERWCDMLLAHLAPSVDVVEFAFEADRAREFAGDLHHDRSPRAVDLAWQLVLASLRASFQTGLTARSPNADLNQQIGSSILAIFHADIFDSIGLPKSLWFERLSHAATDAQVMLDELVALDTPYPLPGLRR